MTNAAPPVRLPVLQPNEIASPDDRFWCEPYRANVPAKTCVQRQRVMHSPEAQRPGEGLRSGPPREYHKCVDCALGRLVEQRVGKQVGQPTPAPGRRAPRSSRSPKTILPPPPKVARPAAKPTSMSGPAKRKAASPPPRPKRRWRCSLCGKLGHRAERRGRGFICPQAPKASPKKTPTRKIVRPLPMQGRPVVREVANAQSKIPALPPPGFMALAAQGIADALGRDVAGELEQMLNGFERKLRNRLQAIFEGAQRMGSERSSSGENAT